MCGVFGYIGKRDAVQVCLNGLELLEYRGYDSAGIAAIQDKNIALYKKSGKVSSLKQILPSFPPLSLAIAHTRWATHGKVNDQNAHPHFDQEKSLAVIHNGIIENYDTLRTVLQKDGVQFTSDTDTEVIAHLLAKHYKDDLVYALHLILSKLQGIYALIAIHRDHPEEIVAAAHHCPLAIAIDKEKSESIVSSDPNTLVGTEFDVIFLQNKEVARIKKGIVEVYGPGLKKLEKTSARIIGTMKNPSKEGFEHFMLKEIFEQPVTAEQVIVGRFDQKVSFDELKLPAEVFQNASKILFIGCGTSAHAGSIGALLLEDLAQFPAICCIASEARYRKSLMTADTLVIAISQSGETADTLSALRAAKQYGCATLAICNVMNSTLAREADGIIDLQAGPELSVCSTKAFTSQVAILSLFALFFGQLKKTVSEKDVSLFHAEMKKIPEQIQNVLKLSSDIEKMAKKYARFNDFFFMGRRYMFPTCLEAALKLKEISYVNANGYPAGELKHGPLALLDAEFPVVAFLANRLTEEKMISNLMEVKARGSPLLAIAPSHLQNIASIADDVVFVPDAIDPLALFPTTIAGQLFAYYFAKIRGCDIDQPRNLAKSVTVE
ncbi:MAG TPA: glutamine--fructose-6-phosphate transaminase (isomerizing) [Chlamydiales bacterium]|nr:glutamine--fructose-6-phosphate transaminase (isomerizing) [Chlamydiales bacterium]